MSAKRLTKLPVYSSQRLGARIAEAISIATNPALLSQYPIWVQKVMGILRRQLLPTEFASLMAPGQDAFTEGVVTAFLPKITEIVNLNPSPEGQFIDSLLAQVAPGHKAHKVVRLFKTGKIWRNREFREQVLARLSEPNAATRRAFAQGLALGSRLDELCDIHQRAASTDATEVYMVLWLYWPEIDQMQSVGEAGRALGAIFAPAPHGAASWDERFRKLANRIGLSYRRKTKP